MLRSGNLLNFNPHKSIPVGSDPQRKAVSIDKGLNGASGSVKRVRENQIRKVQLSRKKSSCRKELRSGKNLSFCPKGVQAEGSITVICSADN